MAKFERVTELPSDDSYSDWIQPVHDGKKPYKLACCDCGLVHDVEFKVMKVVKDLGNGYLEVQDANNDKLIVHFRARRNNRSTGQMRRHKE